MRSLSWVEVSSDKDTNFTDALALNAGENEDIATSYLTKSAAIVGIQVQSIQNLDWEIWFSSKLAATNFGLADLDLDGYLGRVLFALADGKAHGDSAPQFYYSKELATPIMLYDDVRTTDKLGLHMRLVNRNATAKITGATGAIKIRLVLDMGVH